MNQRKDMVTASRVDQVLAILPTISWLEACCALAALEVPVEVAARVMALPAERRPRLASQTESVQQD